MTREQCLYRHFDASDALLYVGITCDIGARLRSHAKIASWFGQVAKITIERHADREAALAAEGLAIRTEKPKFNRTDLPEVEDWVTERCDTSNPDARSKSSDLFADFKAWCAKRGHQAVTVTAFGRSLGQLGFRFSKDGRGARRRVGIATHKMLGTEGYGQLAKPSVLS
jgi:predicted GIY-YIG superfamily endonuclease